MSFDPTMKVPGTKWQMIPDEHTFDVGQVQVKTNSSHSHRLRILKMTMENWNKNEGIKYSEGDDISKLFKRDLFWVKDMLDNLVFRDDYRLNMDEMLTANKKFKRWGT